MWFILKSSTISCVYNSGEQSKKLWIKIEKISHNKNLYIEEENSFRT